MNVPTPPDDDRALAATVGALHRIAGFITGQGRGDVIELRDEAIRLAGQHLSANRLAEVAGVPFELIMTVLCS
ncbi:MULTISPECIES: hypothetical protein [unclassified Curtobacterium]|uniref:hypothetical protein n=1 Tax=unclassified Curtobacterium TaxID=257496 RepID=UPI003A80D986